MSKGKIKSVMDSVLPISRMVEGHLEMADSQLFGKNINYSAETLIGYLGMSFKFGTAINCIDGRTQEPVIDFMKQKYDIDGVDMVTFPGVDGVISSSGNLDAIALMQNAVSISIEKHGSRIIAVVGHFDCAGNPGNREHHYAHIANAIQQVSSWNYDAEVVGLYVNDKRQIEEVNRNTMSNV